MTFLVPIQISFFIFSHCFLKISFANAKDNNAPKKQNQKVKIHHVIRKKKKILLLAGAGGGEGGEGGSEGKVDATAEKCVLSGDAEPRCAQVCCSEDGQSQCSVHKLP